MRLIAENLAILTDRLKELQNCILKDIGNTTFHFHLWEACDAFISLLYALNERYDPATKRPEQEFRKFGLAPAELEARYGKLLEGPFDRVGRERIVATLTELVEETTQLIKGIARR